MAESADTALSATPQTGDSLAEAAPAPPTPDPRAATDNLRLLCKVASAFQDAANQAQQRLNSRYYVVVERTWRPTETMNCDSPESLRTLLRQLRTEAQTSIRQNANHDLRVTMFRGSRLYLRKWPHAHVTDGTEVIPLDTPGEIPEDVDDTGSLVDEPNLASRPRAAAPPEEPPLVRPSPLEQLASAPDPLDEEDALEEGEEPLITP